MSYTVLARRYRSQSFDEIVGQNAIARTLNNAIEQDRVGHAYLFVGTRGVGKTTMARVFAKALNGGSEAVDAAIMSGRDTDVIEIDAASNSKVDETRELISNCVYKPLRGKFKVYIIDEVHMLSIAAFNALLKTLEEPPEHVKFVLCTTETHKVPATIQSRCQRFDFRNLATKEIADHLAEIVGKESIEAEPELLTAVARIGNGSMRDALSMLDRLIAAVMPGESVTLCTLELLLGLPNRELIAQIVDTIADADPGEALGKADTLLAKGISLEQVIDALAGRFRDLMVLISAGAGTPLVDLTGSARERAVEQSARFDAPALVHHIAICEHVARSVKSSSTPRALFDALLVRLATAEHFADVAALLSGTTRAAPARAPAKKA